MSKTSRRAVLIGAAALTAAPAAATAAAQPQPDPIFAAIEAHKRAFQQAAEARKARFHTVDAKWAPEYDAARVLDADAAEARESEEFFEASFALTEIRPTTVAGIVALIGYVEDFNGKKFGREIDWPSDAADWPNDPIDGSDDGIEAFPYDLLSSIRRALEGGAA